MNPALDARAIEETRRRFEPRRLAAHARWGVDAPAWCEANDPLMASFRHQARLFGEGRVVWASFVQANAALFQPGDDDCAALVVYDRDGGADDDPHALQEVAAAVHELGRAAPDAPELAALAALVADEGASGRGLCRPLEPAIAAGLALATTSLVVHRDHLPGGLIEGELLPLLVHEATRASLVLPCEYWSEPLLAAWGVDAG